MTARSGAKAGASPHRDADEIFAEGPPSTPAPDIDDTRSEYTYRRPLAGADLLKAIGLGLAAGAAAFYVAAVFLQRTPLDAPGEPEERTPLRRGARPGRRTARSSPAERAIREPRDGA